jgi:PKD repeat protein
MRHLLPSTPFDTLIAIVKRGRCFTYLLLGGSLLLLIAAFGFGTVEANLKPISQDTGLLSSGLEMAIAVSPPAGAPGDAVALDLILTNYSGAAATPEVVILAPANASLVLDSLPVGTSYNVQTGALSWLPFVPPSGGVSHLSLNMTLDVADLKTPVSQLQALLRHNGEERLVAAQVWIGVPPVAAIAFDPPRPAVGQPVRIVANASGPGPFNQVWTLGDGRIVNAADPTVIYSSAGSYEIRLQLSNPLGSTEAVAVIEVTPEPVAIFEVERPAATIGQAVSFMNRSGGQGPLVYEWDFADGTSSAEANPVHHYTTPGVYQVRLTASNEYGQSEAFWPIAVGEAPVADMVIDSAGEAGRIIRGQAFTDDSATSIRWDMGDGVQHEGEFLEHIYWSAGDYFVTLSVDNEFGEIQVTAWVQVRPGMFYLFLPLVARSGSSVGLLPEPFPPGDAQPLAADLTDPRRQEAPLELLDLPPDLSPAEQLLAYINEARMKHGLPMLNHAPALSVASEVHARDMATAPHNNHVGSDGSSPALRIQRARYPGRYTGEATAWGMQHAIAPVQYWLTSEGHRAIILNPLATEVGVGFAENYSAPSIWYWAAEFAAGDLPAIRVDETTLSISPTPEPTIQLLGPPQESQFALSSDNFLIFTWSWPLPLQPDERFGLYLNAQGRFVQIGAVNEPAGENQYQLKVNAANVPAAPGDHQWQVRLENTIQGNLLHESPYWSVRFLDALATVPTLTPTPGTDSGRGQPSPTPTPSPPAYP